MKRDEIVSASSLEAYYLASHVECAMLAKMNVNRGDRKWARLWAGAARVYLDSWREVNQSAQR